MFPPLLKRGAGANGRKKIAKIEEEIMGAFHLSFLFPSHQKSEETHYTCSAQVPARAQAVWGGGGFPVAQVPTL